MVSSLWCTQSCVWDLARSCSHFWGSTLDPPESIGASQGDHKSSILSRSFYDDGHNSNWHKAVPCTPEGSFECVNPQGLCVNDIQIHWPFCQTQALTQHYSWNTLLQNKGMLLIVPHKHRISRKIFSLIVIFFLVALLLGTYENQVLKLHRWYL